MMLALTVGVLVAGATYLVLQREMVRIALGFLLLSHAVNLVLLAAGGTSRRGEALGETLDPLTTADPLPQAFVLTAIVIAFAITIYMVVLAVTGREGDDLATSADDEDGGDAGEPPAGDRPTRSEDREVDGSPTDRTEEGVR